MSICKPAGPMERSSSIARDNSVAVSEMALRAKTAADSLAKEIFTENRTSRSIERTENFDFIGTSERLGFVGTRGRVTFLRQGEWVRLSGGGSILQLHLSFSICHWCNFNDL